MHLLNNIPDLTLVRNACRALNDLEGIDVHTIKMEINGYHGGWDLYIQGTNDDMENWEYKYVIDSNGNSIEATDVRLI